MSVPIIVLLIAFAVAFVVLDRLTRPRTLPNERLAVVRQRAQGLQGDRKDEKQLRLRSAGGKSLDAGPLLQRFHRRLSAELFQLGWQISPAALGAAAILVLAVAFVSLLIAGRSPIEAGAGAAVAIFILRMLMARQIKKARANFVSQLPDALDLLVRGVRSGLPVGEAIHTIGNELEPPVATAFAKVADYLAIGLNVHEALTQVATLYEIPEFNFLTISISVQQETGGNLAEILENLSTMIRKRDQLRLKVRAMSSEARASAMIIGCLPFVMTGVIYFVNPDYMMVLFEDPRGNMLLGMAFTSLSVGCFTIARMIKFDI